MAQELIVKVGGLATEPNPSMTDVGAAIEAKNVWFPRHGECEPRPAFDGNEFTGASNLTGEFVYNLYFYNDDVYAYTANGSYASESFYRCSDGTEILNPSSASFDIMPAFCSSEQMQGNLYFPTNDGVLTIRGTETTARRAGLPRPSVSRFQSSITNGLDAITASSQVAYQMTYVLEVGNQTLESVPSPSFYYRNTSAQAREPSFRHYLNTEATTDWKYRVYRTRTVATDTLPIESEMFQVLEGKPSATDISNGYVDFTDTKTDSYLGTPLYSNGTQQTISKAKWAPPRAKVIKAFNGMMFYGNTTAFGNSFQSTVYQEKQGTKQVSATSGSATLTVGLQATDVGQYLALSSVSSPNVTGQAVPAMSYISSVNVGGGTATINQVAAATTSNADHYLWSQVSVGGTSYYVTQDLPSVENASVNALAAATATYGLDATTWCIGAFEGQIIGLSLAWQVAQDSPNVVVVPLTPQRDIRGYAASDPVNFSFQATPARPGDTLSVSSQNADNDIGDSYSADYPGRLYWSELDQPEAVPLVNQNTVGDETKAILAMARTRDSLFVFKEDGTWRVTGATPNTVAILEYDRALRLVHPQAVCEMGNKVYAWTNHGVISLDENGWESISDDVIASLLQQGHDLTVGVTTRCSVSLRAWPTEDYLILAYDEAGNGGAPDYFYAFSVKTGQWSRWQFDANADDDSVCIIDYNPEDGRLYFGGRGTTATEGLFPFVSLGLRQWQTGAYTRRTLTIASNSPTVNADGTYTIAVTNSWTGQVGDGFVGASVVGVAVSTGETGDGPTITFATNGAPTGNIALRRGFECEWQSVPKGAQNSGAVKEWLDISPIFSSLERTANVQIGCQSDINNTETTVTRWFTSIDNAEQPRALRTSLSRDHSYASEIKPIVRIKDALGRWRLRSISLTYRPVSTRVDSRD